jgi:hypothetical protein
MSFWTQLFGNLDKAYAEYWDSLTDTQKTYFSWDYTGGFLK